MDGARIASGKVKHLRIIIPAGAIIFIMMICVQAFINPPVGNVFSNLCGMWVNIAHDSEGRERSVWDCMDKRIYNQLLTKEDTTYVNYDPTIEAVVASQSGYCSLFDAKNPYNPPSRLNARTTYPTSLSPRPEYVGEYFGALETGTQVRLIAKVQNTGPIVWYLTKLDDGNCAWLQDIDVVFDEDFNESEIPWIVPTPSKSEFVLTREPLMPQLDSICHKLTDEAQKQYGALYSASNGEFANDSVRLFVNPGRPIVFFGWSDNGIEHMVVIGKLKGANVSYSPLMWYMLLIEDKNGKQCVWAWNTDIRLSVPEDSIPWVVAPA